MKQLTIKSQIESFFRLFGGKSNEQINPKPEPVESISIINPKREIDPNSPEVLLNKATKLKKSDFEEAVNLIKQAIEIDPSNSFQYSLKILGYLHSGERKGHAIELSDKLFQELDANDIYRYNFRRTQILEKLCTICYKDDEYEKYLSLYSDWLINSAISFAVQGKAKELRKIINEKNKLKFLAENKIKGCFIKLNKEDEKENYNSKLTSVIDNIKDDLLLISEKSAKLKKSSKTQQERYEKLKNDGEFWSIYENWKNSEITFRFI